MQTAAVIYRSRSIRLVRTVPEYDVRTRSTGQSAQCNPVLEKVNLVLKHGWWRFIVRPQICPLLFCPSSQLACRRRSLLSSAESPWNKLDEYGFLLIRQGKRGIVESGVVSRPTVVELVGRAGSEILMSQKPQLERWTSERQAISIRWPCNACFLMIQ